MLEIYPKDFPRCVLMSPKSNAFHPCREQMLEKTDTGASLPGGEPFASGVNLSKLSNFSVPHLYSGHSKGLPHPLMTF